MGNGFETNEVNFKVDAGPDREPMEITNQLHDAGVHVGFGYKMYSIQGGLSRNACKIVLYSLQLFDVNVHHKEGSSSRYTVYIDLIKFKLFEVYLALICISKSIQNNSDLSSIFGQITFNTK